jgi:hypothetical protein
MQRRGFPDGGGMQDKDPRRNQSRNHLQAGRAKRPSPHLRLCVPDQGLGRDIVAVRTHIAGMDMRGRGGSRLSF